MGEMVSGNPKVPSVTRVPPTPATARWVPPTTLNSTVRLLLLPVHVPLHTALPVFLVLVVLLFKTPLCSTLPSPSGPQVVTPQHLTLPRSALLQVELTSPASNLPGLREPGQPP